MDAEAEAVRALDERALQLEVLPPSLLEVLPPILVEVLPPSLLEVLTPSVLPGRASPSPAESNHIACFNSRDFYRSTPESGHLQY